MVIENVINFSPMVNSSQTHAFPLSVLCTNKSYNELILNNHIQLELTKNFSYMSTQSQWMYADEEVLHVFNTEIPKIILNHEETLLNMLNDLINDGFCIILTFNEKHIPSRMSYNVYDYDHSSMVYGYDEVKREYSIIGYNDKMKYKPSKLSYDELLYSIKATKIKCVEATIIKPNEAYNPFIDIVKIKNIFYEYLESINTIYHELSQDSYFGINALIGLREYVDLCSMSQLNLIHFYCISEHKKLMQYRMEHIVNINGINFVDELEDYLNAVDLSSRILMLSIKYNLTKDISILAKLKEYIDRLIDIDFIILSKFYKLINVID